MRRWSGLPPIAAAFCRKACSGDDALRFDVQALLDRSESDQRPLEDTTITLPVEITGGGAGLPAMIGRTISHYRILERLGAGGMGVTIGNIRGTIGNIRGGGR